MARYADGDEAAFAELYGLIVPRLFGYLLRRLRDGDVAKDLLQQTLLAVHGARASYIRGADVQPWLFAIARRLLIDHLRRARRDPLRADGADVLEMPGRPTRADELVDAHKLAARLEAALAELPEPQRRAFELNERRGLSLRETAAALQITVGAVKLRLHRAHKSLRARVRRG
ncbi:MAG TPA: RNA polymerase sigma factor [Polyangia bacterium]